jgi:hypothetical protein
MLKIFTPILIFLLLISSLLILKERRTFDVRTLVHIDPLPHTKELISQEKYVEADEYLSYFITYDYVKANPVNQQLLNAIKEQREDYGYKTKKFFEGLTKGKSDEDIGKISAIASDFLVIGDIRDLSIEGKHYLDDQEVDNVIVALSSLGLLATASTFYTLGSTTAIKSSISILKYAKKTNKLPQWLSKELVKQAKLSNQTKSITNLKTLLNPIHKLYQKIGLTETLNLLKRTKNLKELKSFVMLSSRFGKKSSVLLQITKGKAFDYAKSMPNTSNKQILFASTYGENGLKALKKLGESKFIKQVRVSSNLAKTTYKGNLDSLFKYILNNIPNSLLYLVTLLSSLYFIQKLYIFTRKIFHFPRLAK